MLLLLLMALLAQAPNADVPPVNSLRVATFNIRLNIPQDSLFAWPHRKEHAAALIRYHDADIVGVQEAFSGQLDDLLERLPGWQYVGVGRDDGRRGGEHSAILYKASRLEVLFDSTFWLSETPTVPGSLGWDARFPRVVTFARFRDRTTDKEFFVFNTHFDHEGPVARRSSARMLLETVHETAGSLPAIIMGDFNSTPESEPYTILASTLTDAREVSEEDHYGPEGTFYGFQVTDQPGPRIDHIFVLNGVKVRRHATLSDQWNGTYASDHLPVLVEVEI